MPFATPKPSLQLHRINSITTQNKNNINMACQMQLQPTPLNPSIHQYSSPLLVPEVVGCHHAHAVGPNQCCSSVVQSVAAPVSTVWSVVRRFDKPQVYKHFVKSCHIIAGEGNVGTLREVHIVSGLPAATSTERLEILDDERHILGFSLVGGDHRLSNYRSVTTLHSATGGRGTIVVESYVVDVPPGNTKEDTCIFVDTIIKCNLLSLAKIAENSIAGSGNGRRQS